MKTRINLGMTSNTTSSVASSISLLPINLSQDKETVYRAFNNERVNGDYNRLCLLFSPTSGVRFGFKLTLDKKYRIDSFIFVPRKADPSYLPKTILVQGSNDGTNFKDIALFESYSNRLDRDPKEFKIPTPGNYKYYNFLFTDLGEGTIYTAVFCEEIELYTSNLYLMETDTNYMSIKKELYDLNIKSYPSYDKANNLDMPSIMDSKGFDNISDLYKEITIGDETFRPIDKLNLSSFRVLYKH